MYLRNAWYIAATAQEVSRSMRATRILGEPVVLYRTENGDPVALADACPHRKLPLSMGRVKGDAIECGYHGLVFDSTGQCVRVPGVEQVPKKICVRSYPVIEKFGHVWIWMGEESLADLGALFPVEHYGAPDWSLSGGEPIDIACNYLLVCDNLLDPSHVAWVHQGSFGFAAAEQAPVTIDAGAGGVTVSRWMMGTEIAPLYRPLVPFEGPCDRLQHYEVRFPAHALIIALIAPAGTGGPGRPVPASAYIMNSYNFMTPVDEGHTRYYYFQISNVAPRDPQAAAAMAKGIRDAFLEDKAVLEACQTGLAKAVIPPINLPIDAGPLKFRRRLETLIAAEGSGGDDGLAQGEPAIEKQGHRQP